MSEQCNHPKHKQKSWHDSAVLCKGCGCVISQFGKVINPPAPLFDHVKYVTVSSDADEDAKDIVIRLQWAIDCLEKAQCKCDLSVGYICEPCGEGQLLVDARNVIQKLSESNERFLPEQEKSEP